MAAAKPRTGSANDDERPASIEGTAPAAKPARAARAAGLNPAKKALGATEPAPAARTTARPRKRTAPAATAATSGSPDGASAGAATTDVQFHLPVHGEARQAALVGDFNGWSHDAHPMTRHGDSFEITVPLQPGRHRYRYLVDGARWENDWNADEYVPNDFGSDDSVRII